MTVRMTSLMTHIVLLIILCIRVTSSNAVYHFGFYSLAIPGTNETGLVQVYACTPGGSANVEFTLSGAERSRSTSISSGSPFSLMLEFSAVAGEKVLEGHREYDLGLRISADEPINVYAVRATDSQYIDGFDVPELTAHSTEFFVVGWIGWSYSPDSVLILAAGHPDTFVEIYRVTGGVYRRLHSISLQRERSISHVVFSLTDTTGLYVNSTRPISVFSHVTCAQVPLDTSFCGYMAASVPPLSQLGYDFVVPPLVRSSASVGYVVRVVASTSSTSVGWASTSKVLPTDKTFGHTDLSVGEFHELDVQENLIPLLVACNKPCLVVQYNKGAMATSTGSNSDPFMMVTTPSDRFINESCFTTPVAGEINDTEVLENFIVIVTLTLHKSFILLDASEIGSNWIDTINHSVTTLPIAHGWHSLSVVSGTGATFGAYVYGRSVSRKVTHYGYGFAVGSGRKPYTNTTTSVATPGPASNAAARQSTSRRNVLIGIAIFAVFCRRRLKETSESLSEVTQ